MLAKNRSVNEIEHGKILLQGDPEEIWGWGTPAGKIRAERRAALITSGAHLRPGVLAMEVGCGTGHFTQRFARSGARIDAIDISADLLTIARGYNLPEEQVRFIELRLEDAPEDNQYDAVIGSGVLHHIEIEPALQKIFQILKPGGYMAFTEPNMLNPVVFTMMQIPFIRRGYRYVSPDESAFYRWQLQNLMKKIGYSEIHVTPFDWLYPSTPTGLIPLVEKIGRLCERLPGVREISGSFFIHGRRPVS